MLFLILTSAAVDNQRPGGTCDLELLVNNTHQHSQTIVTTVLASTKKRIAAKELRFRGRCHFFIFQIIGEIRAAMMHDTRSRRPGELWPDRDRQFQSLRPKYTQINSNSHNIKDVRVNPKHVKIEV